MAAGNKTTLFLGDLSTYCAEQDIHAAFVPYGEIIAIKIMKNKDTSRNLSYGFITFQQSHAAKTAMNAMNGVLFCGRRLRVGWASFKNKLSPKPMPHDAMQSAAVQFSYITYQLDKLVTEESLRVLFSAYGVVQDVSIRQTNLDQSVNRQTGYGFVHFPWSYEGIESAVAVVAGLNGTVENVAYACAISHKLDKYLQDMQQQAADSSAAHLSHLDHSSPKSVSTPHYGPGWVPSINPVAVPQQKVWTPMEIKPRAEAPAWMPAQQSPPQQEPWGDVMQSIDHSLLRSYRHQQMPVHDGYARPPAPLLHKAPSGYDVWQRSELSDLNFSGELPILSRGVSSGLSDSLSGGLATSLGSSLGSMGGGGLLGLPSLDAPYPRDLLGGLLGSSTEFNTEYNLFDAGGTGGLLY